MSVKMMITTEDDRPLVNDFDALTGRPIGMFNQPVPVAVEIAVEAPAEVVEPVEAEAATPVAEAPVEAAVEAPEAAEK